MVATKTPGQKRKAYLSYACIALFAVTTFIVSGYLQSLTAAQYGWVSNPEITEGRVTSLDSYEEEYRNMKGRKRFRTVYSAEYSFQVNGESYEGYAEPSKSVWSGLNIDSAVEVWHEQDYPSNFELASVASSEIESNNIVMHATSVAPFTGFIFLVLYWVLGLFVRESKKALPEGFYREDSWLDVDDNYLVFLQEKCLCWFSFDHKKSEKIQTAYQKGVGYDDLARLSGSKLKSVSIDSVSRISSARNYDVLKLQSGDKVHEVEFLNQAVKAHALERIIPLLPLAHQHKVEEKSRFASAMPALVVLAAITGICLWFSSFIVNVIGGLLVLSKVLPRIIARLLEPTTIDSWEMVPEEQNSAEADVIVKAAESVS